MELRCPSCGVKHNTEDHPEAFEIGCVCGYSILVPNEAAFKIPVDHGGEKDLPAAFREGDQGVQLDDAPAADILSVPAPGDGMTSPDDLPEGMAYDAFELKSVEDTEDALPGSAVDSVTETFPESPENIHDPGSLDFLSESPVSTVEDKRASAPASSSATSTKEEEDKIRRFNISQSSQGSAQAVVERALASSMGQFLGPDYKIRLEGLSREKKVVLARRCEQLLKHRPWALVELEKRGINLSQIPDGDSWEHVPELLALELYLGSFELGGSCHFERG